MDAISCIENLRILLVVVTRNSRNITKNLTLHDDVMCLASEMHIKILQDETPSII
jgi:hypothetical protein